MKNPRNRKRLTANQSELVATYLPQTLQKNRKLTSAVKLVLANIYQLHYLQKNWGKRTVFRSREDFMNDIDAKFKEDVIRPQAKLIELDLVYIRSGVRGRATEYTLNDELYELLPTQIKGYISEKFKGALPKLRGTLKCDNELIDSEISDVVSENTISAPLNSVNNSDLQHLSVPSESESLHYSDNNSIISKSINKKKMYNTNSIKEKKLKRKESGVSGQGIHSEEGLSDFDLSNELNTSMQSEGEQDRQGINETVSLSSKDSGENNELNIVNDMKDSQNTGLHSNLHQAIAPFRGESDSEPPQSSARPPLTGTPKRSYGDVYWQIRKKIEMGKGFSEQKVRDYVTKNFIITGEVPQHEFESDLSELLRLKESLTEKRGYATENDLVSTLTSEPFVPYGLTAEA